MEEVTDDQLVKDKAEDNTRDRAKEEDLPGHQDGDEDEDEDKATKPRNKAALRQKDPKPKKRR